MALVSTVNFGVQEPTGSRQQIDLNVRLDATATAPVTVFYYFQQGTATVAGGDYDNLIGGVRSLIIPAGSDVGQIEIDIRGDALVEGDEEFSVVIYAGQNAELPGNAAALVATATVYDADDAGSDPDSGVTGPATLLPGPAAMPGILPTVDVRDTTVVEGSGFNDDRAVFLVSLDRPATADVTGFYYFEGETAWTQGPFNSSDAADFSGGASTFTIPAGQQSTTIDAPINPDAEVEPNETYHLVLGGVQNAQFSGGAAALVATGTILDDDSGVVSGTAGLGGFAEQIAGPEPASATGPTVRVYDTSVLEANFTQTTTLYFLVTLDQPASEDIPFQFAVNNGSAVSNATPSIFGGDFEQSASGVATILAGRQSVIIPVTVNGDAQIEGDEVVTLVLSGIRGAVFEDNAVALQATGTILSDDDGPVSGLAGIGDPGRTVYAPLAGGNQTVVDVIDVSIIEGEEDESAAFVYVTLSEPATGTILVDYETVAGTATAGSDFDSSSGTLSFVEGQQSSLLSIDIIGDSNIEGDESLFVRFSGLTGAVFANGQSTMDATIEILGNDGAGSAATAPTGPDFNFTATSLGATEGNDLLNGTAGIDVLRGQGGDDLLQGLADEDVLRGGLGNDTLQGGDGADVLLGQVGNDQLEGGLGADLLDGGLNADTVLGGNGDDTVYGGAGNDLIAGGNQADLIYGGDGGDVISGGTDTSADTIYGDAGADQIGGGGGNDMLFGGDQEDVISGGDGQDTSHGGSGNDTVAGGAGNDSVLGDDGLDVLIGGLGLDSLFGGSDGDRINGNGGDDALFGELGNDTLSGGLANDSVDGGAGNDELRGNGGNDTLHGNDGDDDMRGDTGNDLFVAGNGNDRLIGGVGDDRLLGQTGNDILNGGGGDDTMSGGGGTDRFIFNSGFGNDQIADFQEGLDTLLLGGFTAADVNGVTVGNDLVLQVSGGGNITIVNGVLDGFDVTTDVLFV